MCNFSFISLFIFIWKTGVENNILELNAPSLSAYVEYSTIQLYSTTTEYNFEATLWTIFTLQTSFAGGGGRGGGEAMSSCTVLHSCHPVTYKYYKQYIYNIYISDLYTIINIYSSNIQYLVVFIKLWYTYFVIPSSYLIGMFLIGQPF